MLFFALVITGILIISGLVYYLWNLFTYILKLKKQFLITQEQLAKEIEHQKHLKRKIEKLESDIVNTRMDDQLTGLPSKQLFQERLGQILSQSQRYHFVFALMMLELDNFRMFQNVLGLEASNELLKEVAARLQSCIRPMDVACRADGSEFVFIISQLVKPETASYVAKRLLETISNPFVINNQEIFLTGSIGITIYPDDGDKPNILIQ
ncbi:MAG: GGDEF domain-containing protein, partial [Gammaproteobacteria bacterium]|nr:GGDEF domain-containing protein [Gammaproteobacteria bacterium]